MAIPLIRAVGTVSASAGTAISPGLPTGTVAGDLLVMFIETQENEAITATDWLSAPSSHQTGGTAGVTSGNCRLTILYKIAVGGDATTTSAPGNHAVGRILGIQDGTFDAADPFNTSAGDGDATVDTSITIPGATTTRNDCLIVAAAATGLPDANGTTVFSAWANASLANLVEQIDNSTAGGNGGAIGVATGELATGGAYSATTATNSEASASAHISLAIQPEGAAAAADPYPYIGGGYYPSEG